MKKYVFILLIFLVACTQSNPVVTPESVDTTLRESGAIPKPLDTVTTTTLQETGIDLMELSKHNSETDCWVSYEMEIYDVTSWIPKHPGGKEAIIQFCGTANEFSKAFTDKHAKSKVNLLKSEGDFKGNLMI